MNWDRMERATLNRGGSWSAFCNAKTIVKVMAHRKNSSNTEVQDKPLIATVLWTFIWKYRFHSKCIQNLPPVID